MHKDHGNIRKHATGGGGQTREGATTMVDMVEGKCSAERSGSVEMWVKRYA